jgi:peptidyl-prolyl cis-trans isomerase C
MARPFLERLLREPLLHFLVLGGLIFALLSDANVPQPGGSEDRIVISGADVERLAVAWTQRWQRPPTEAELNGLIGEAVREQVLYREALALGLDRDDVVIRRHLRQKYEFLTQDLAFDTDPDEATLRAFHDAQSDRYALAGRLTFSHILFNLDRRGATALTDAERTLAELQSAKGPEAAERLGDATSLPAGFNAVGESEVEAVFGPEFAAALRDLKTGRWAGPIASGYGLHLVWLSESVPAARPAFEDIRERVKDDWTHAQRIAANDAVYRALLDRYEVVVEPMATAGTDAGGS